MKNAREISTVVKVQAIIEKFFNIILLVVALLFLIVGVYALVDNRLIVKNAEIPDYFKQSAMADREYPDIRELQKTNPDIVAWLTLDNTPIDYPITMTKDNVKYLAADYAGKHSIAGNPFVDYRNNFLHDDYTIIYGHRMNHKKMFGSLTEYATPSYLQQHQTGSITTVEETYSLEVLLYSVENVMDTKVYDLVENRNGGNDAILKDLSSSATAINGKYQREDLLTKETRDWKLLLLSTCDKDSRHYRDVLLLRVLTESK